MLKWKKISIIQILMTLFGLSASVWAQSESPTYADRLNQSTQGRINKSLGTLSGRDTDDARNHDLFDSYSYVPSKNVEQIDYMEFRNEHHIPNYMGDDSAIKLLKKPDTEIKNEVVKVVETEKLLHESFQAFHDEKEKIELEKNKGASNLDKRAKEMETRIDIIGTKSASMLSSSIEKLHKADERMASLMSQNSPDSEYFASGGRVVSKLELTRDKDLLGLQSHVIERIQKELLAVFVNAINDYYQRNEKENVRVALTNKEELLAFVKVEQKAKSREALDKQTEKSSDTGNDTKEQDTNEAALSLNRKNGEQTKTRGSLPDSPLTESQMHENIKKALELANHPQTGTSRSESKGSPLGSSLSDSQIRENIKKALELANNPPAGSSPSDARGSAPGPSISESQMKDNVQRALDLANNPPK